MSARGILDRGGTPVVPTAVALVRTVRTVHLAVAFPPQRDASLVAAFELALRTPERGKDRVMGDGHVASSERA
jgi:hypothetical protein